MFPFPQETAESGDWLQTECPSISRGGGSKELRGPVSPPLDVLLVSHPSVHDDNVK